MPKTFREMVAINMSRNLAVYEPRQEDRCWYTVEDVPALLSYRSGIILHGLSKLSLCNQHDKTQICRLRPVPQRTEGQEIQFNFSYRNQA